MCFSATASFVAGAGLVRLGGVAMLRAARTDPRYLLFAAFPVLFGLQQMVEGRIWLGHEMSDPEAVQAGAMIFLFFAYLLWLVLSPLATLVVEDDPARRRVFTGFALFGAVFGAGLFVPLLVHPDWITVGFEQGAIVYDTSLIGEGFVSKESVRAVYAAVICLPLLASTAKGLRGFGLLVALSVVLASVFETYAFTSIWCFLAALVSGYLVALVFRLDRPQAAPVRMAAESGE